MFQEKNKHLYNLRSNKEKSLITDSGKMTSNLTLNQSKTTKQKSSTMASSATAGNITQSDVDVSNAELKAIMLRIETSVNEQLKVMKQRVDTLYELVGENETNITDLGESLKEQGNKIEDLTQSATLNSEEVDTLKNVTIPRLETSVKNLTDEIKKELKLKEIRDRKYNLLFYGAEPKADKSVYETVRDFLTTDFNFTPEDANDVFIVNAHRLPRRTPSPGVTEGPAPIIVKFGAMADRDFVLENQAKRGYIQGRKPIVAYTDLPPDMKRTRGKLAAEAKQLRAKGQATRIRVIGTEVILEHRPKGQFGGWKKFAG